MTATWRLRVELNDRPGALARLATSLAERDCNILALTVLPVPDGVIDDLVVSIPEELRPADLVTLVRAIGGRCAGITAADVTELTDAPTAALRAITQLVDGTAGYSETVRALMAADAAQETDQLSPAETTPTHVGERGPVSVPGAHGTEITVRRGWAPFTDVEVARAGALAKLVSALGTTDARAVITDDGAGIVLREGRPEDADAVAAMHDRCSRASLFTRYHAGTRSIPRRLLHRLLAPPRGLTVVGVVGFQVIAVGQLIKTDSPDVGEVSLLVEDDWQSKGVGSALLTYLARIARAAGHTELFGWCLPGERGLAKAAHRAGFEVSVRHEEDLLRVGLATYEPLGASSPRS